jgi:hypothetical protein
MSVRVFGVPDGCSFITVPPPVLLILLSSYTAYSHISSNWLDHFFMIFLSRKSGNSNEDDCVLSLRTLHQMPSVHITPNLLICTDSALLPFPQVHWAVT